MKYQGLTIDPPKWAKHLAMDSNGHVYAYACVPKRVVQGMLAGYWLAPGKIKFIGNIPASERKPDAWYFSYKEINIQEK